MRNILIRLFGMGQRPAPHTLWGIIVCGLGFHKREFSYGYEVHLDRSRPDDYYGTIFCGRCSLVLSGGPATHGEENSEEKK